MDPAIELATLVVSYLWPLCDLFPRVQRVADFADELGQLPGMAAEDFALLARLRDIAERTDEESWKGPSADRRGAVDRGTRLRQIVRERTRRAGEKTPSGKASMAWAHLPFHYEEATKADYVTLAREELSTFQEHTRTVAAIQPLANLPIGRTDADRGAGLTREEFTRSVVLSLLEHRLLAKVATTLDYRPLLLRNLAVARGGSEGESQRCLSLLCDEQYPDKLLATMGDGAIPFELVLHSELAEIDRSRSERLGIPPPPQEPKPAATRAFERSLFGVALSGGGVRSATFALGVLQGLANHRWLPHVDYLSTVSGGGYIGAWLLAWVKRRGSIHAVQESLGGYRGAPPSRTPDPQAEHVRPIRQLREYSNYLAPRFSTFSSDTWTLVSIWTRNTVLNLLVLTLFMMAALMVPRVLAAVFMSRSAEVALFSCSAALVLASLFIGLNFRSFERSSQVGEGFFRMVVPRASFRERGDTAFLVVATIVVPAFVALLFAVRALVAFAPANHQAGQSTDPRAVVFTWAFWILLSTIMIAATLGHPFFAPRGLAPAHQRTHGRRLARIFKRVCWSLFCSFVAAAIGAAIVVGLWEHAVPWLYLDSRRGTWVAMAFGPLVLIAAISAVLVLYLGLEGRAAADERREWWSRLGGWMNLIAAGWAFAAVVSYFSPYVLATQTLYLGTMGSAWASITAAGAWLGASGKSNGINLPLDRNRAASVLIAIAPYVFILGFFVAVTVLTHAVMYGVARHLDSENQILLPFSFVRYAETYWANLDPYDQWAPVVAAALLGSAFLLAWRVDVNEFSMHHFYRNRLVRAFLGASRSRVHRRPNAFTGLDMDDDVKLWRLRQSDPTVPNDETSDCRPGFAGPFAILNATLNITTGEELAFQERKGQSFVFTPLYCGYDFSSRQTIESEAVGAQFAFRPTRFFTDKSVDGGVSLGTAAAISGAAANPNAGHHSSPAVAFLLTVFNARLGWWLGNPRLDKWTRSSPGLGLGYLLSELFGFSGVHRDYVNLSDGGHFDNMGLYELVRRRCRYILLCDAEQDDRYAFNGLAGAIRKCRIDFGVVIDIPTDRIKPLVDGRTSRSHVAVGTITYPGEGCGTLIYLKASLTGREPVDVQEYQRRHAEFPHQTTRDQFFDESQFESYRVLGQHIADGTFPDWPAGEDDDWRQTLEAQFARVKAEFGADSESVPS